MRTRALVLLALAGCTLFGQTAESPEHMRARLEYERVLESRSEPYQKEKSDWDRSIAVCIAVGPSDPKCTLNMDENGTVGRLVKSLCQLYIHHDKKTSKDMLDRQKCAAVFNRMASAEPITVSLRFVENLKRKVDVTDPCLKLYHDTIDKKIADLTTRELDQIQACKALDLYPPSK
jgi:hypothetical protein